MKPPRLAIVTSMSKGMTLYTHIHLRKDKFTMNKTTNIAQQISQVCMIVGYMCINTNYFLNYYYLLGCTYNILLFSNSINVTSYKTFKNI